jgi:hypothetical protein
MSMDRREIFKILSASLVAAEAAGAQHSHAPAKTAVVDFATYKPRLLSADQYAALTSLCSVILPSEPQSPGAHEVGVPWYIDTVLFYGDAATQNEWRQGLDEVDRAAKARFDQAFAKCKLADQDQMVAEMAEGELRPATPVQRFFRPLKQLIIEGYCLSAEAQRKHFGYKGDIAIASFPGCTHPDHQA